uniref:UPF3 domain-containing protein n=1 Tax=Rhinolophus ferrumequinum TaxID=59479 RepID=A0A671EL14_RHIFE
MEQRRGRSIGSGGMASGDSTKGEDKQAWNKEKREELSQVVIRRLPSTLTNEQLQEHFQPISEHDYFEFFSNDTSLYPYMHARAYINFKNQEDSILFRVHFDGYVFLDNKIKGYPAIVEFALFQKAAKRRLRKEIPKLGSSMMIQSIENFWSYATDNEKMSSTPSTLLEEIEAKNRKLIAKKRNEKEKIENKNKHRRQKERYEKEKSF